MEKLNIAMITSNYLPFIGGVSISVDRLSTSLRKLGHNVHIFAPNYKEVEEDENVTRFVSVVDKKHGYSIPFVLLGSPFHKFEETNFDIIHLHHPFLVAKSTLNLKDIYNIPVTYTYHTRYEHYVDGRTLYKVLNVATGKQFGKIIKNVSIPTVMKKFCNKCDLVIAPSKSIYDHLKELKIKTKIETLPTGLVDNNFFCNKTLYNSIKNEHEGKFIFVSVLRLSFEKNIEELIDNVKEFKEKYNDNFVHLIVGGGPLKEELQKKIDLENLSKHIILVGLVDKDDVSAYYSAADLFLFTSKSETQGMVVLEAMAGKTPIVAHDATGVRDYVDNNYNGLLSYSNEEFVKNLNLLVMDSELRKNLTKNAHETALNYHSDLIAEKFVELYKMQIEEYKKR